MAVEPAVDAGVEQETDRQRVAPDPGQPTQAEIDEHEVDHSPFRPWCEACCKGRAKDHPSFRVQGIFG